jgi:hypothetical protein
MLSRRGQQRLLSSLFLAAAAMCAQTVEQEMEARVEELIAKHGNGTDEELKQRLVAMAKRDQSVRKPEYVSDTAPAGLVEEQERVDAELTTELKAIVARKGWPTIRLVGLPASEHAALILMHSRDHDFQRSMLPQLRQLAESGEILGSSVATIVDKILISEGKRQRFGTQFKWANGVAEMLPVDDTEHLEERRAKYLLPPLAEYKKMLADFYKLKVK